MLDDLNKHPSGDGQREVTPRTPAPRPPMTDREVPIVAATPFEAMHRWLDGDASEAEAQRDAESARYVALWRRVGQETSQRRGRSLSPDFVSRVMSALPAGEAPVARAELRIMSAGAATAAMAAPVAAAPAAAPVADAAPAAHAESTSWLQRPLELSGATALTVGAGLLAVGALFGLAFRGQ